ncbi:MAG: ABC transporter ATP-binding protein [Candidatus Thermoplasmatota archaeon]|nr:ABC transporter ATP-binding protein [Candidatus Thermoplasmatota archaeon]MCL5731422.1 ABC transporter ATP-binding protein [Candidatus Thermoplasmatota archaeon]
MSHPAEDGIIQVNNLVKAYGDVIAVDGISFRVNHGEVFSILGPNGAGKTTTVEILEGVRKRDSGDVRVLGMDPSSDRNRLMKVIGILPQDFNFMERVTPYETLEFYIRSYMSSEDPVQLLKLVDLYDKRDTYFTNLSGGQKQKLGIAIALSNNPRIVFLDEPTAGLDPISRRSVWEVIRRLKENGKTVILTTHYLDEAEALADRVAIVKSGKIVDEGSPAELVARNKTSDRLVITFGDTFSDIDIFKGFIIQRKGNSVEIKVENNEQLFSIFSMLSEIKVPLQNIELKHESLEDVFIKIVGEVTNES